MGLLRLEMPPNSNVETGFGMPRDVRLIDVILVGPSKTEKTNKRRQLRFIIHEQFTRHIDKIT